MKYLVYTCIVILLLLSCCTSKESRSQLPVNSTTEWKHKKLSDFDRDTCIFISKEYSKDSSFLKASCISIKTDNPSNAWDFTDIMYMKGQDNQYHVVHMLGGADAFFIYTDSTKSRYLYDKRGKYFLTKKEVLAFWELLRKD